MAESVIKNPHLRWLQIANFANDSTGGITVTVDTTQYNEYCIKTGNFQNGHFIEYYVTRDAGFFASNYELWCPVTDQGENIGINQFIFTDNSIKFTGASSVQRATIYAK